VTCCSLRSEDGKKVTAEVWVNEKRVGERVWESRATNSNSNRRAEADPIRYIEKKPLPGGEAAVYMDTLSLNGLLGTVALVPYEKIELHIPH
jgi:hypothetical protein